MLKALEWAGDLSGCNPAFAQQYLGRLQQPHDPEQESSSKSNGWMDYQIYDVAVTVFIQFDHPAGFAVGFVLAILYLVNIKPDRLESRGVGCCTVSVTSVMSNGTVGQPALLLDQYL